MFLNLTIVVVRALFLAVAGWILWKGWRRIARRDSAAGWIVAAGLVLRAFAAQVLFWVSYLHLPIGRRMQGGDGFWKFAVDSNIYFGDARILLGKGWHSVLLVDRRLPSPVFLQSLAVFLLIFGAVVAVGALLNLFAYWAFSESVLFLGGLEGRSRLPTLVALAAVSFSPSLVLWSTQPLKDAFFVSAVAVFVAACSRWRKGWVTDDTGRRPRLAASLFLLIIALYAIVGIRWYFGMLMCLVSVPFLIMTVVASRRRVVAGIVNALVFLLMLQLVVLESEPYLPRPVVRMLKGFSLREETARDLVSIIEKSRAGFEASGGGSQIREGETLAQIDRAAKGVPDVKPVLASAPQPLDQPESVPRSTFGRIAAGTVAVVIPRFLSESLGIIHIGGAGGLWVVIEADTILFDMLLLIVIFHVVSAAAAGALRDPSFWLVALMTAGIAILLTYTVSNFGTLFRHRSMILVGLSLLLAVTRAPAASPATPEPVS